MAGAEQQSLLQHCNRDTARRVFEPTHPQHQLPLGSFYLLQEVAVQFTHTPPIFPTLRIGIPARTWWVGQHPCMTHARCANPWKRKGESVVWVWRQPCLEQLLCAKILVCNGFINCSIQTYRTVTPLGAETHWERDLLSQVTLPETSDTI